MPQPEKNFSPNTRFARAMVCMSVWFLSGLVRAVQRL